MDQISSMSKSCKLGNFANRDLSSYDPKSSTEMGGQCHLTQEDLIYLKSKREISVSFLS